MNTLRISAIASFFLAVSAGAAHAQDYERVDVNDQGQASNDGALAAGSMSNDGRYVAFISYATNFGGVDIPGTLDVFVRDRTLHTTTRVTSTLNTSDAHQYRFAVMSGDGSKLAFSLQSPIGVGPWRSFVYSLATATTTEILLPNVPDLRVEALSLDGRFAALTARAISDSTPQVYRLDLTNGALVLCSRTPSGTPVGGRNSDIDDDGTRVSFESTSSQLVSGDTNGASDIFVFDVPHDAVIRASVTNNGGEANDRSLLGSISGNGRFVAMWSLASNMVPGDTDAFVDMYLRDLRLNTTSRISLTTQQQPIALGSDGRPFPSADASSVAFASHQIVGPGDSSSSLDVFLRDIDSGALLPSSPGDPMGLVDSLALGISANGREVLLFSYQHAIVPPSNTSGVFVAKFGPRCSTSGYCTSLPNSTGDAATIGTQGDASRALNNLVIAGVGMPPGAIAMLVSGTSAIDPGAPFGNGLLCVGGSIIRHGIHGASGGVVLDHQDVNSPAYAAVHPGDTRNYQFYYRDPAAGGALFNTTDAVAVTFCW